MPARARLASSPLAALAAALLLAGGCATASPEGPRAAAAPKRAALPPLPPRPPSRPLTGKDAAMVAEVTKRAAAVRHLAFLHPVHAAEAGPAMVTWIVHRDLRDEIATGKLAEEAAMLQAFGLLAPGVDLEKVVTSVMDEQARGLYDWRDRTLLVIGGDGSPDQQVFLLHEMVHALQDQHFGLKQLMDPSLSEDGGNAHQALVEGDATFAMYDDMLSRTASVHVWQLPNLAVIKRQVQAGMRSPENRALAAAPRYLRDTLLSAYVDGMIFIDALYHHGGYAEVDHAFANPPATTEQILHPDKYLAGEGGQAVPVPAVKAATDAGWREVTHGTLGELGLDVFLGHLAGGPTGDPGAGWGGDTYRVLRDGDGAPGVVWSLRFDDAASGARVAGLLAAAHAAHPEVVSRRLGPTALAVTVNLPPELAAKVLSAMPARP